jgi:hypothetical protein
MRKFLILFIFAFAGGSSFSQPNSILIRNALIIDGTGRAPLKEHDILIEKGIITKIKRDIKARRSTQVIDASGKTVIPGIIDMHGHLYGVGAAQPEAFPLLYLAAGVTTVFSPGEFDPEITYALKEAIKKKEKIGPDIFFAGPYFDTKPSSIWVGGFSDTTSIAEQFDDWKDKIEGVKVYSNISQSHFDFVMQKAKKNGLFVTGHLGTLSTKYVIEHGIHGLEHGLVAINDFGGDTRLPSHLCHVANLDLTSKAVDDLISLIISKKVYVDPTLTVLESLMAEFSLQIDDLESYFTDPRPVSWQEEMNEKLRNSLAENCLPGAMEKQLQYVRMIHEKEARS